MEITALPNPHHDNINDISFDYYGRRFASCSNDKDIKIWSLKEDDGENENGWDVTKISPGHNDVIWRLSWAHPEFGQVGFHKLSYLS